MHPPQHLSASTFAIKGARVTQVAVSSTHTLHLFHWRQRTFTSSFYTAIAGGICITELSSSTLETRMAMEPVPHTISFVGAGAMAEAIVSGWLAMGMVKPDQLSACDPSEGRREIFKKMGANVFENAGLVRPRSRFSFHCATIKGSRPPFLPHRSHSRGKPRLQNTEIAF